MAAIPVHTAASAAKAARAERNLIQALRAANAVSATKAAALPAIEGLEDSQLERLVQSGVIGRVSGFYYLDQVALEERTQTRRTAGLVALVIAATAVAVALLVLATRS
jgi:hypothetical protein